MLMFKVSEVDCICLPSGEKNHLISLDLILFSWNSIFPPPPPTKKKKKNPGFGFFVKIHKKILDLDSLSKYTY